MSELVIYPKTRSLLMMIGGCLLLIVACVYPLVYGFEIEGRDSLGRFFAGITPEIFYIGAPLFTLPFLYLCYRLVKPAPSIVVNEEGILDNASAFGAGLIRWEEIKSMFIYEFMGHKFLGIIPVDEQTILARQSPIKRSLFKMGSQGQPAPFAIPGTVLPMPVEELLAKIQLYQQRPTEDPSA